MTDKLDLSWYPTTIEELQRLLDSGVWPRIRAIADDVGPLQIAQGRLTYIDIEKDGMSGILREGPAPAGAEPFDLTSRTLWLWRAESSASSTPKPRNESALAVERLRADRAMCDDALRRIADASRLTVLGQRAPEYAMELAERVEKQLALRVPVLRTDDEQIDRAALDRLTAYMRINHAHSLNSGEHVADVATWALAKYAKDHGLLCEQLGLLPVTSSSGVRAAIKGMAKDIDDDQLGTDREIAGAAEQLVRRLVDRLVETDPEYIEQLRRGRS